MKRSLFDNIMRFRHSSSGTRCAVLHIGTEKTGSTSLQTYLSEHRSALYKRGVLFPQTCGLSCHSRLVAYSKDKPDARLLQMIAVADEPVTISRWKSTFRQKHHKEVMRFHASCQDTSTVIYSSEHFQSLVRDVADIKRVHSLLCDYYDKITLVVYLKRQDRMAFSAHNTAVQSGSDKRFSFDDIGAGYYYDHLQLISNWASVFGQESVIVRVCEKPRLHQKSVVSDLLHLSGLSHTLSDFPPAPASNERLSSTALELMLSFNREYKSHTHIRGVPLPILRKNLIDHLRSLKDNGDGVRPTQAAARRFYAQFEASNAVLSNRFLDGEGFDQSFSEYPTSALGCAAETAAAAQPEVSDELLDSLVEAALLDAHGAAPAA